MKFLKSETTQKNYEILLFSLIKVILLTFIIYTTLITEIPQDLAYSIAMVFLTAFLIVEIFFSIGSILIAKKNEPKKKKTTKKKQTKSHK